MEVFDARPGLGDMKGGKGDMKGPPLELYMKKEEMDSLMGTQDDGDSMQAQCGESDASDATDARGK